MSAFNQSTSPHLWAWLALGKSNLWIREAWDPPLSEKSFHEVLTIDDLRAFFEHGNWCLGQAVVFGDLCFIQQQDGGDEWLVLRGPVKFESASCAHMIAKGTFDAWLADVQAATDEQLLRLEYRRSAA